MKKFLFRTYIILPALLFTGIRIAHGYTAVPTDLLTLAGTVVDLSNSIAVILSSAALLGFLYGAVKMIIAGNSGQDKGAGKSIMLTGLVGLFVIVSLWGILQIAKGIFFR